jgi:hypothetical protein
MNDNLDWALAEGMARQRADQLVAGLQGRLGLDEDHIVQQMLASPALQLARITGRHRTARRRPGRSRRSMPPCGTPACAIGSDWRSTGRLSSRPPRPVAK